MNSESTIELLERWSAYSRQEKRGSLSDFAHWLLVIESKKDLTDHELTQVEHIKFKIYELSKLFESSKKGALKFQEFRILSIVSQLGDARRLEVIAALHIDNSTGFYFIKELCKKRFLQEKDDPKDARASFVSLTEKGKQVLRQAKRDFNKDLPIKEIARSQKDREAFISTLDKIYSVEKQNKAK